MSITAGLVLLGVGTLALLSLNPAAWFPGLVRDTAGLDVPHASAPFFVLCLGLWLHALCRKSSDIGSPPCLRLFAAGTFLYAIGTWTQLFGPQAAWLLPLGAFLAGLIVLAWAAHPNPAETGFVRPLLGVFALGLGMEGLLALNAVVELPALRSLLGGDDDLRQRLLRLARVAAVMLPLLALLLADLRGRHPAQGRSGIVTRWLTTGLALGAVGMPLILTLAALVHPLWKYLLPLPADLTLAGTLTGAWLAFRCGSRLERAGWLLIAASMSAGMLIGGYAFDGPLPSPVGNYTATLRTLMRNWHAAAIVIGLALILSTNRTLHTAQEPPAPLTTRTPEHPNT